jgi:hypothetical protein
MGASDSPTKPELRSARRNGRVDDRPERGSRSAGRQSRLFKPKSASACEHHANQRIAREYRPCHPFGSSTTRLRNWAICSSFPEALFRTRTLDPLLTMEVSERHGRARAITRDTLSPANRTVAGSPDASRDVACVVSDVSVLCPRTVVYFGNAPFANLAGPRPPA